MWERRSLYLNPADGKEFILVCSNLHVDSTLILNGVGRPRIISELGGADISLCLWRHPLVAPSSSHPSRRTRASRSALSAWAWHGSVLSLAPARNSTPCETPLIKITCRTECDKACVASRQIILCCDILCFVVLVQRFWCTFDRWVYSSNSWILSYFSNLVKDSQRICWYGFVNKPQGSRQKVDKYIVKRES